jgi:predicted transposase YdaD
MPDHNPHDKLFKKGFGDPVNAAGFLRHEIPAPLAEKIDWERLHLESGSFVDSHFREGESDLLFSAPFSGRRCFLYILFEHQSTPEPAMALRLLRYMVRIWEGELDRRKHGEAAKLSPILPVVLAQNSKVWRMPARFSALFELPEELENDLLAFIPDFLFRLVQLAEIPFDAIRGTPAGIVTLRAMKARRTGDLLGDAVWDEALLGRLSRYFLDYVVRYVLEGGVDKEAFEGRIKSVSNPQIRSTAMTIAEELRKEGRKEAMQNGILDNLEVRFGPVPEGLREAVEAVGDEERLRSLHRASITAASLEEFAREL